MAVKTHQSVSNRMRAIDNNGYTITTIQDVMGDFPVQIADSQVMLPTETQSKLSKMIQTHNAVSIPASGWSLGQWIDTDGFSDISVNLKNDAVTPSLVLLQLSHDGVSQSGEETLLANANNQYRSALVQTKARYIRFNVNNADSTLAHTMNIYAYLKA